MRQRNRENRKKQTIPHTGDSKANATRRTKMMPETGQWPGRAQMYIATHKNQNGVYVNETAKEIYVLGPEHSGRVRCLGLRVVPSRVLKQDRPHFNGTSASSSGGSCSFQCRDNFAQMMNSHNQIMSALKTYMIMKKETIPEQFVGLFDSPSMVSPTASGDVASGPLSPVDARRSRNDNDPNDIL